MQIGIAMRACRHEPTQCLLLLGLSYETTDIIFNATNWDGSG